MGFCFSKTGSTVSSRWKKLIFFGLNGDSGKRHQKVQVNTPFINVQFIKTRGVLEAQDNFGGENQYCCICCIKQNKLAVQINRLDRKRLQPTRCIFLTLMQHVQQIECHGIFPGQQTSADVCFRACSRIQVQFATPAFVIQTSPHKSLTILIQSNL